MSLYDRTSGYARGGPPPTGKGSKTGKSAKWLEVKRVEIRRIQKHGNSNVIAIPKTTMRELNAKTSDYLIFNQIKGTDVNILVKVGDGVYEDVRDIRRKRARD